MELIRVVGNVFLGMVVVIIAFTSKKTPLEACRFLFICIFDRSKERTNLSDDDAQ